MIDGRVSIKPCKTHTLAVPNSWSKSKQVGELANMIMTYRRKHGGILPPPPCEECGYWSFDPPVVWMLRDLRGSIRGTELEKLVN